MRTRFQTWIIPLALLILCVLGFGLLIPWLGFYWDDWPVIATMRILGVDAFWNFYKYDRPFSAWTYVIAGPLLGSNQLLWHTFTLLLKWSTVLGMWWSLRLLWPARKSEVTWMAFLFAVYPIFTQQPVAVAFSQHWISYSLYFLSVGLMLVSIRQPGRALPLTIAALVASSVHMFTMEYFTGLELLRPLLLWIVVSEQQIPSRERVRRVMQRWTPYLLLFSGAIIWRLFFLETYGEDPNRPVLLFSFFETPLPAALRLFQLAAQEYLFDLFSAWHYALNPAEFDLTDRLYLSSTILGLIAAILVIVFLNRTDGEDGSAPVNDQNWHRQAIALGFVAVLLGSLPVWLTDRQALNGLYGSRFGLAAMFGASLLLVGLLDWLTPRRLPKIILVGTLAGLAIAFHLRSTVTYVQSWQKQHAFYWQLYWRAPALQPGTALLSADELFLYVGRYSTTFAINLLYPQPTGSPGLAYWFVELPFHIGPQGIPELVAGKALDFSFRNFRFTGDSRDSLAIFYEPDGERCLWVLSPEDRYNPDIPEMLEDVLPISNLALIDDEPGSAIDPPAGIFGKEPSHTWCYFYQKSELARQQGEWQRVVELAEQAQAQGLKPANPHERLPWIEAYARTGQWVEALDHTRKAYEKNTRYASQLCYLWENLERDLEIPPLEEDQLAKLRLSMQCTKD